ncbi:MAG TPA: dTMP kinase [Cellvibrionaceae bacterium]|nr:dTMP kinase [Cellvibrionaceae bacterium]HNG59235.1 dTMP kinase [Cellvibrionaceae bacterium]
MSGFFISLEGVEGVGKSTNLTFIADWLKQQAVDFILTREPGGTELAEAIRTLLLTPREEAMAVDTELLLVFAARAQHVAEKIRPALARGQTVISDRFVDATYAYQGFGRGLPLATIESLHQLILKNFLPHLTIYLDLDVETGLARARQRGELDRFERETAAFFERVRAGYLARVQQDPKRFAVIDASLPLEQVQANIAQVLANYFKRS